MPSEGRTPFHQAALTRGVALEHLLAAGADVHARDGELRTPLHNASLTDPDHVRVLVAAGADLEARDVWIRSLQTAEQVRLAVIAWARLYNERWLIERHGYRSPNQVRTEWLAARKAA